MLHSLIVLICIMIKLNMCSSFTTHNSISTRAQKLSVRDFSSSNCDDDAIASQQQQKKADRFDGRRNFISFVLVNSLATMANAADDEVSNNTDGKKNGRESSTLLRNVVGGAAVAIIIKDVTSQSYSLDSVDGIDKRDCALCKDEEKK